MSIEYAARPIALQVELTNHCPYTCKGCPRTEGMTRPLGMMSAETFQVVLDAVRADQRKHAPLALHHMGEALLHPELTAFVERATRAGVPTSIACRPNLLTPARARALLEAGVCSIIVSLDGMSTPTLRTLTGKVADYERSRAHIDALLEAKRALGSAAQIQLQMIAYAENEPEWRTFLDAFPPGDPDVSASLKRFSTWTVPELAQYGSRATSFLGGTCTRPLWSYTVLWDGRIVPCNRDHDGEVVLGNIHDGLEAVWHGEAYRRFREAFDADTLPAEHMCRRCTIYPWHPEHRGKQGADAWFGGDGEGLRYSESWWLEHWGARVEG